MSHAPHDFIPGSDGDFDAWQANYVAYALAHSPALGLSHADVESLEQHQAAWHKSRIDNTEALAWAHATTAKKNNARNSFERVIRSLSARIRALPAIGDAQRAALGLSPIPEGPGPVPAPGTVPLLSLARAERFIHVLRLADSATPLRTKRPRGTIGAELRLALLPAGETPPPDPADFDFHGVLTRSPAAVDLADARAGLTAHYAARWLSTRGQPGPWSATLSATVMG